ncbi:reduced coenzyme F420:NADP oxidoreductase [Jatrophihabitans sp. GAS493]|uniref:NADPH-dependent F420 reductase n=1 Tax=Jatrophihabitans sp. GAS493 TaxID=1907575 RepID=UPI000BB6BCFA|nr:NADPH-dependent F420 reductase [Jatrophihabitans sp. GAS493]SOD74425.1 reduced coenzyme F420:NADP oxidoreductase [Jatrophihabitans sp. GAS493]
MTDVTALTIAILGGTGGQGQGLAYRFANAGVSVIIGSRDAERAHTAADELSGRITGGRVTGASNAGAASAADVIVVAVPWEAHEKTLTGLVTELKGKIVVDCVNPMGFDERGPYPLLTDDGSAAEEAARLLPDSTVVAAFHHVSAVLLSDPTVSDLDLDVLVLGEERSATDTVQALAELLPGVRGIFGGRLRNAGQVEALTANLIAVNRRYKTHAGIRITGL